MDNEAIDASVAIAAIAVLFGLPISGWIVVRVLVHLERMEMIKHGLVPPPDAGPWGRHGRGAWRRMSDRPPEGEGADDSLRRGVKTTMIGLALLIGLSFIGYHRSAGPFGMPTIDPGPWLLGGLIPTFIGVAQILVALMAGARLAGVRRPSAVPPPHGTAYEPPPAGASYQPPPRRGAAPFEETLPPSARPPDRR